MIFRAIILLSMATGIWIAPNRAFPEEQGTNRERIFMKGLERFDEAKNPEDYLEVAALWESLLEDDYRNGALYFNLGNAYFRAGQMGRAILNYRKAIPYRPRDPYLRANLQQAIANAPGHLGTIPQPWWKHVLFWTDWVSYPTKANVFFGVVWILPLALGFASYRRSKILFALGSLLLAIGLGDGCDLAFSYEDAIGSRSAVIIGETVARKGTGESYETAFDQPLRDGAEFIVLDETNDWTFGRFSGIGDGWVKSSFVAR